MGSSTRTRNQTAAVIAAAVVLLAGCSNQQPSSATTSSPPLSAVSATAPNDGAESQGSQSPDLPASSSMLPTVAEVSTAASSSDAPPAAESVASIFAARLAMYDRSVLELAEPGSIAHTYAEGAILLYESGQFTDMKRVTVREVEDGWDIGEGVVLSDFKVGQNGTVTSLSRNGVSIDTTIVPGDGTEYVATPGEFDKWTGTVTTKVHSFRIWDDRVIIFMLTTNNSSGKANVLLTDYAVGGKQVHEGAGSSETLPEVTRLTGSIFEPATGGGKAYGSVYVDGSGGTEIVLDVPAR